MNPQDTPLLPDPWLDGVPGNSPKPAAGPVERDLGFDPDSPDVADPQTDPPHPPRIPEDAPNPRDEKRAPSDQYPPYEKP